MGDVVLIADDDKDIVRFVALNLRLEGFDVVAVHDGREALAKALDMQPSLILLDTMMPGMDGYEVCTRLRGDGRGSLIPVIMLTRQVAGGRPGVGVHGRRRRLGDQAV